MLQVEQTQVPITTTESPEDVSEVTPLSAAEELLDDSPVEPTIQEQLVEEVPEEVFPDVESAPKFQVTFKEESTASMEVETEEQPIIELPFVTTDETQTSLEKQAETLVTETVASAMAELSSSVYQQKDDEVQPTVTDIELTEELVTRVSDSRTTVSYENMSSPEDVKPVESAVQKEMPFIEVPEHDDQQIDVALQIAAEDVLNVQESKPEDSFEIVDAESEEEPFEIVDIPSTEDYEMVEAEVQVESEDIDETSTAATQSLVYQEDDEISLSEVTDQVVCDFLVPCVSIIKYLALFLLG